MLVYLLKRKFKMSFEEIGNLTEDQLGFLCAGWMVECEEAKDAASKAKGSRSRKPVRRSH